MPTTSVMSAARGDEGAEWGGGRLVLEKTEYSGAFSSRSAWARVPSSQLVGTARRWG